MRFLCFMRQCLRPLFKARRRRMQRARLKMALFVDYLESGNFFTPRFINN